MKASLLPANRLAKEALEQLGGTVVRGQSPALTLLKRAIMDGLVEVPEWMTLELTALLDLAEEEDQEGQAVALGLKALTAQHLKGQSPKWVANALLDNLKPVLADVAY